MCQIFKNWINRFPPGLHITYLLIISLNLLTDHHHHSVFSLPAQGNNVHFAKDVQDSEEGPNATEDTKQWLSSEIDEVANSLQKCVQYPGMSLAVVKLGKENQDPMILTRHYGVLDIQSKRPVDDDTRFCIASLTKGFTAALLVQLLEENELYTLDTSVRSILGADFQLITPELTEKTSIRDILAHRVGIAKHFGAFLLGYNFTRHEIVRRVRHLPVLKQFRASQVYNNFMYVIAGQLAEKLNGSWWETQTVRKLLKPLKMDQTTFADKVADWNANFALPHALENGKLKTLRPKVTGNIHRPVGPAGSICTTSGDMAKWLLMHLQNGLARSGQVVLNDTVLEELFDMHNTFPKPMGLGKSSFAVEALTFGYGLGWVIGNYRDTRRIFNNGFSNYYYSMASLLPEKGIAVFSTMNGPHLIKCDNGMKALHFYITDLLLGEKPWLNASNICSYPRQWLQKNTGHTRVQINQSKVSTSATEATSMEEAFSSSMSEISSTIQYLDETTTIPHIDEDVTDYVPDSTLNPFTGKTNNNLHRSTAISPTQSGVSITRNTLPIRSLRRTIKLKKRLPKITTPYFETTTAVQDCDVAKCHTSSTLVDLPNLSGSTNLPSSPNLNDKMTSFSSSTPAVSSSSSDVTDLTTSELSVPPSPSKVYGVRLQPGMRPLRRRRPRRHAELFSYFKKYEGIYRNPFFGEVVISINRTVPALQLNYGYYGRALLEPLPKNNIFRTHFFNSIWYQSESDDMKLLTKLGIFDVQFGSLDKDSFPNKVVIFQFDVEKPPVFTRERQKNNAIQ